MTASTEALDRLMFKYPKDLWTKRLNLYTDLLDLFVAFPSVNTISMLLYTSDAYNDGDRSNTIEYHPFIDGIDHGMALGKNGNIYSFYGSQDEETYKEGGFSYTISNEEETKQALALLCHMDGPLFCISSHIAVRAERMPQGSIKFIEVTDFYIDS